MFALLLLLLLLLLLAAAAAPPSESAARLSSAEAVCSAMASRAFMLLCCRKGGVTRGPGAEERRGERGDPTARGGRPQPRGFVQEGKFRVGASGRETSLRWSRSCNSPFRGEYSRRCSFFGSFGGSPVQSGKTLPGTSCFFRVWFGLFFIWFRFRGLPR